MPTPIIELQRRLTLVGAIRCGGEKPERGVGKRLEAFRLTSPRKALIEQAAELYGGTVTKWRSPVGDEWQTYTDAEEIPVLVMPGYSLRQSYELWEGATKRTRLCDGIDEEITGGACICASEGADKCDLYTRLVVALPELDTVLGWRLISRGANAGHELPTMLALIESRSSGQSFVPARLRLDERRGVKNEQVVRFVVPVLDLGISYAEIAQKDRPQAIEAPAAPPGYVPAARRSPSVTEALDALTTPRSSTGGTRSAELPDPEIEPEPAPLAEGDEPSAFQPPEQTRQATVAQRKKLDVLVGTMREAGHIRTDHLYDAVGQMRESAGMDVATLIGGYDVSGDLHWAPLRENLTRMEASKLLDRLEILRDRVKASA